MLRKSASWASVLIGRFLKPAAASLSSLPSFEVYFTLTYDGRQLLFKPDLGTMCAPVARTGAYFGSHPPTGGGARFWDSRLKPLCHRHPRRPTPGGTGRDIPGRLGHPVG